MKKDGTQWELLIEIYHLEDAKLANQVKIYLEHQESLRQDLGVD